MIVPQGLIVVCLSAMMVLGAYIVYKAIKSPPKGGESQISAFDSKLVLKGPAWLIMIAVGAIVAATPVIAAIVQRGAAAPFSLPEVAQVVGQIDEPEYRSFLFLRDASYLDLRSSQSQPWFTRLPGWGRLTGRHTRIRPATLVNYMLIKKVAGAEVIHMKYSTSGTLDMRCLTHPCTFRKAYEHDHEVGEITADVRDVQVNEEFTLITEVTYWNAFSGTEGDDYSTYTHNQTLQPEEISVIITFPELQRFRAVDVLETPPGAEQPRPVQGPARSIPANDGGTYYWSTSRPGPGRWYFTLKWTW